MWDGMSVCLCFLLGEEGEIVELYLWGDFLFFFFRGFNYGNKNGVALA